MIFVSTGGYSERTAYETIQDFMSHGLLNIELSSGLHDANMMSNLIRVSSECNLTVHNYFPPPAVPFVFNLASCNPSVALQSIEHAKHSIKLSSQIGDSVYSFHAGFLVDPKAKELGGKIKKRELFDRHMAMEKFLANVWELDEYARDLGVKLLIENNVLSKANYQLFAENPVLMATESECIDIMNNTSDNVNMLLDVAHLWVSSETLGYDPYNTLKRCDNWIKAYHLSDNDRKCDSNSPITNESWFIPYLNPSVNRHTLEIYNIESNEFLRQVEIIDKLMQAGY